MANRDKKMVYEWLRDLLAHAAQGGIAVDTYTPSVEEIEDMTPGDDGLSVTSRIIAHQVLLANMPELLDDRLDAVESIGAALGRAKLGMKGGGA